MSQDTSKKAPREFWINQSRCNGKAKAYDTLENTWGDTQHNDTIIHVVEFSAYKDLKQQALLMREALAFYADVSTWNNSTRENIYPPISRDADDEQSVPGNKARQALEQFDEFMKEKK